MSSTIFFVALVICVSNNLVMTNVNTNTNMPNINIPIASIEPMYHMKSSVAEHILAVQMGVRYYVGKGQTFAFVLPKAENPVYRYVFHAYGMDNKKGKEKPALRMKTESMKNEDCKFKVLFVCTGNGYRSPICEALLKKLRPDLEVDSAGTKITSKITKEAREYLMSEDAIQFLKKTPESIDSKQLEQYDIIIAMEQRHRDSVLKKCPECKNKVVVWNIRDKIPFFHRRTEKINNQMKENVTEYAGSLV